MSIWFLLERWLSAERQSSHSKNPADSNRRRIRARLRLETLEDRLPPGGLGLDGWMGDFDDTEQWLGDTEEQSFADDGSMPTEESDGTQATQHDDAAPTEDGPVGNPIDDGDDPSTESTPSAQGSEAEDATSVAPYIPAGDDDGLDTGIEDDPIGTGDGGVDGGGGSDGFDTGGDDTTDPTPMSAAIGGISEDRGASSGDYVTNDASLTVFGTGTPGAALTLLAGDDGAGGGLSAETTIGDDGTWSVALPQPLAEGTHSLVAIAIDPTTGADANASQSVTIDLTAPEVRLDAPTYTFNPSPSVLVTASGLGTDGGTAFIDVDVNQDGSYAGPAELGHAQGGLAADGTGVVQLNDLDPGTYKIRARVMDLAGNAGHSLNHSLQVGVDAREYQVLHFEENVGQTNAEVDFQSRGHNYSLFVNSTAMTISVLGEVPADYQAPGAGDGDAADDGFDPGGDDTLPDDDFDGAGPLGEDDTLPDTGTGDEGVTQPIELEPGMSVSEAFRMSFVNPAAGRDVVGMDLLPGKTNYLIGNDAEQHFTGIDSYSQVRVRNLYSGVDVVYQGSEGSLRYDFLVRPGADAGDVQFKLEGAQSLSLNDQGGIDVGLVTGTLALTAPVMYQVTNEGEIVNVDGGFVLGENGLVTLDVGAYDETLALIIDPTFVYSTFTGGSLNEAGEALDVDAFGSAYIAGQTQSADYPTTMGVAQAATGGNIDGFVTKIDPSGTNLVYSTYIGGGAADAVFGLRVSNGIAYIGGSTASNDFPIPVTANTFDPIFGTDGTDGIVDGFVAVLNLDASEIVYSTYLGGGGVDAVFGLTVDVGGVAYATGATSSFFTFPITAGVVDPVFNFFGNTEAFLTALDTNAVGINPPVFSTYFGGNGEEFGRDVFLLQGEAYVVGDTNAPDIPGPIGNGGPNGFQTTLNGPSDAFLVRFNGDATDIRYSTYLGGDQDEFGIGVAVDAFGNAYVTGETESANQFPILNAFQPTFGGGFGDAYVTKVNTVLGGNASLVYSSYLGGNLEDQGLGITLDGLGQAYVTGRAVSTNFPIINDPTPSTGFNGDVILTVVDADGDSLLFSTVFGGVLGDEGRGIKLDSAGNVYIGGLTRSQDFPVFNALQITLAGGIDAFVTKIQSSVVIPPPPPPLAFDDVFEDNQSSDQASVFGSTVSASLSNLSINNRDDGPDFDWFRFTAGASGTISVTMDETSGGPLEVHLFALNGNVPVELSVDGSSAASKTITGSIGIGQDFLVHVKGVNTAPGVLATGSYDLTIQIA